MRSRTTAANTSLCGRSRSPATGRRGKKNVVATQDDVRRAALALSDTVEADDRFAFSLMNKGKAKGFAWVWQVRVHPKKARVPNPDVVAIRVADESERRRCLAPKAVVAAYDEAPTRRAD